MQLDDNVCLCFHVSKRKILNFIRVHQPRVVSQISECEGAGTGCGWCRDTLAAYFAAAKPGQTAVDDPTPEEYARSRASYIRAGGGTPPPGATPIDDV
ncbi:MAG: (2Fe-2S)-binding protein [Pirellulales bacterium]|nr:(2Fe-2S)-binding protein [Pirellulales bacterium]